MINSLLKDLNDSSKKELLRILRKKQAEDELKEFILPYDKARASKLLRTLTDLKRKIDSNIIPQRLPDYPLNWQCRYCSFIEVCRLTGEGSIDWERFKKKIESV